MGYKLLGYIVWRGARLVIRRKYPDLGRKVAIGAGATVAAAAVAGGIAVAVDKRNRLES